MGDFELITLKNGQRAVRHTGNGEVMHPVVGPWAEATTLYVEQSRLAERFARVDAGPLCLLDVGLGAATNVSAALACWKQSGARRPLEIHSFEVDLQPLRLGLQDPEGFPYLVEWREVLEELAEKGRVQREGLDWTLHLGDARQLLPALRCTVPPELIFHDPFSPESNPTMWTPEVFAELHRLCGPEGAFLVTYSASTRTRVSLLLGGFFVGVGDPIGFKQETTVAATRPEQLARPLDARWFARWERSSARAPHGRELTAEDEHQIRNHRQFWD
ncbi:MAG: MnmC family methyltransferase [Myxococcota bacterium]|nr:MnmC family methyltransferase [Myxococcota bacterium]